MALDLSCILLIAVPSVATLPVKSFTFPLVKSEPRPKVSNFTPRSFNFLPSCSNLFSTSVTSIVKILLVVLVVVVPSPFPPPPILLVTTSIVIVCPAIAAIFAATLSIAVLTWSAIVSKPAKLEKSNTTIACPSERMDSIAVAT